MHCSLGYGISVAFHVSRSSVRSAAGNTSSVRTGAAGRCASASASCSSVRSIIAHTRSGDTDATTCAVSPNASPKSSTDSTSG
jgi:hypothetical protein